MGTGDKTGPHALRVSAVGIRSELRYGACRRVIAGAGAIVDSARREAGERIRQLDQLRGIAILGIFFMNVPFMAASSKGLINARPDLVGWSAIDQIALFVMDVIAEGTARGMLEMLFGAGMVILTAKLARSHTARDLFLAYYRRYLVLFLLGVAHLLLFLWPGDILSTYAPAALLLFWFRKRAARTMLIAGLLIGPAFFTIGGGFMYAEERQTAAALVAADAATRAGQPLTELQREAVEDRIERQGIEARVAEDRAGRLGDLPTYARAMWNETIEFLGKGIHGFMVIEALAFMLIGAALFKWGIVQGERSTRFYWRMMLLSYAIGVPLRVWSTIDFIDLTPGLGAGVIMAEWARLFMVLGHIALVALVVRTVRGARLLEPFARAGRVALSPYLFQTILGMWLLFPGIGLGLWGKVGWAGLLAIAILASLFQLVIATLYLRHYRVGPVEWLWRRLAGAGPGTRAPDGAGPPVTA